MSSSSTSTAIAIYTHDVTKEFNASFETSNIQQQKDNKRQLITLTDTLLSLQKEINDYLTALMRAGDNGDDDTVQPEEYDESDDQDNGDLQEIGTLAKQEIQDTNKDHVKRGSK